MENPYSGEWQEINKIANDVNILNVKIQQLEVQRSNLYIRLSSIPYKADEEGNDVNEAKRNAIRAQIESVNGLISEANERKQELSSSAYRLSSNYRQQAARFREKASKASNSSMQFQKLSGYRFGASTASAGVDLAQQRTQHYEDYVTILSDLAKAAELASEGIGSSVNAQTISDRGIFNNPNTLYNGAPPPNNKNRNAEVRSLWSGKEGNSVKIPQDDMASLTLLQLGVCGIPYTNGTPDFDSVSHAKVGTAMAGVGMVAAADAMLAKKLGITGEEVVSYRNENGLEWRDDGSGQKANLIPKSISNEYSEGKKNVPEPTPMEALTAYMCAHNYGKKDAVIYMKDPEWKKLHAAAFPDYKPDYIELVSKGTLSGKFSDMVQYRNCSEKPRIVNRETFDSCIKQSGLICFRTFSDSQDGVKAKVFKEKLSNDSADIFQHNGTGYKAFGDGIYVTANVRAEKGCMPGKEEFNAAKIHSLNYGKPGHRATACITVEADTNLALGEEIWKEFKKLPCDERMKYVTVDYKNTRQGLSSYAIAKGYDGLIWKNAGRNNDGSCCDYVTIYNRKKLVVLEDPSNTAFGIN